MNRRLRIQPDSDNWRIARCRSLEGLSFGLDLFWLKDDALEDAADLADPDLIAAEIAEDLRAALKAFGAIAADLASPGLRSINLVDV